MAVPASCSNNQVIDVIVFDARELLINSTQITVIGYNRSEVGADAMLRHQPSYTPPLAAYLIVKDRRLYGHSYWSVINDLNLEINLFDIAIN